MTGLDQGRVAALDAVWVLDGRSDLARDLERLKHELYNTAVRFREAP